MSNLFERGEIKQGVHQCGAWLCSKFKQSDKKHILLVPIMDGGLPFYAEIAEKLSWGEFPAYDFQSIWASHYDTNKRQKGVTIHKTLTKDVWDNHLIVLLDDICDTGELMGSVVSDLVNNGGYTLQQIICCFVGSKNVLDKKISEHEFQLLHGWPLNKHSISCYSVFDFPPGWIVGFGMDDKLYNRGKMCIEVKD